MAGIHLTFTGDDKDVAAVLARQERQIASLKEKLGQLGRESEKVGRQQEGMLTSGVQKLAGMAAGWVSVSSALQLANAELRAHIELQDRASSTQTQAANTQIKFLRNLGMVSGGERQAAIDRIGQISQRTGVTQRDLNLAASTAVSARGDLSIGQSLDAVEMAARIAPEDVGELTSVAGGLLDISSLTKTADMRHNAGFMTSLAAQARVTNLQSVSQNLVPGAIGVAARGGSAEEAAALVATLTSGMKDATGAMSGTAAIQLANQLATFTPAKGESTAERLRHLQNNPALARAFLAQASFEQKSLASVENLLGLGRDRSLADLYERNITSFGDPTAMASNAEQFIAGIQGVDIQQRAARERSIARRSETADLANVAGADESQAIGIMDRALQDAGFGVGRRWNDRWGARMDAALGITHDDVASSAISRLESAQGAGGLSERQVQLLQEAVNELKAMRRGSATVNPEAHTER